MADCWLEVDCYCAASTPYHQQIHIVDYLSTVSNCFLTQEINMINGGHWNNESHLGNGGHYGNGGHLGNRGHEAMKVHCYHWEVCCCHWAGLE